MANYSALVRTTLAEYRKYIEKDSALDRRFQTVKVEAPSVDETVLILKGLRQKYEEHHKVVYTDKALELAAKLSDRYITARFLPDKAIDVLDEAGARARIEGLNRPPEIEELSKEIDKVCAQKEDAIAKQHFEEAAKYRDLEKQVRHKREQAIEKQWKHTREQRTITVGEDEMLQVVSDWTGIPLSRMEQKESQKLLNLEKELQANVVGQEYATEVIAKALRRSRADLKDPRRPIGSFLFLGPTGVGKTHLAKTLAERIFGNQDALLQIDMSEVHGEILGLAPGRLAARLHRLRGRRPAHRGRAPQAVFRRALWRRKSRRRTRTSMQLLLQKCSKTAA